MRRYDPFAMERCKILGCRTISRILIILAGVFVFLQPAFANMGVPMLAVMWPGSWGLLFLIIPLEAYVAFRTLGTDLKKSLKISALANIVSTMVGLPVTWLALHAVQENLRLYHAPAPFPLDGQFLQVFVYSSWLGASYGSPLWEIPTAAAYLCVPFFFMSVAIEYVTAKVYLRRSVANSSIAKWAWIANCITYGLTISALIVTAVVFARLNLKI